MGNAYQFDVAFITYVLSLAVICSPGTKPDPCRNNSVFPENGPRALK